MGQGIVCGGPGACGGFIGVFHFGIHKMAGQPGVHIVHFQLQAVLQGIGAALLGNQRFADQAFQLFKQFRRDLSFLSQKCQQSSQTAVTKIVKNCTSGAKRGKNSF